MSGEYSSREQSPMVGNVGMPNNILFAGNPLPKFAQKYGRKLINTGLIAGGLGASYAFGKYGVGNTMKSAYNKAIGKPARYVGRVMKNVGTAIKNTPYSVPQKVTNTSIRHNRAPMLKTNI